MTPHAHAELEHAELLLDRDPAEAARRIAAVLAGDPGNVDGLCLLARAHLALNDRSPAGRSLDVALTAATEAVRLAPEEGYVQSVLSGVLTQLGRHNEAIAAAELAVRLEPHNAYRHDRLTWALLAAGRRLADALDAARTAVTLDPGTADLHVSYALVADRLGRTADARKALLQALLLDPQHAAARHELATLDIDHGTGWSVRHLARAADGYADALHTDPRQHRSRVMLDVALHRFLHLSAAFLSVLALGGFQLARNEHPAAARLAAAAAVLAPVLVAVWFATRLNPAVRSYLRLVVSGGRPRVAAATAGLTAVLLLVAVAGPAGWLVGLLGAATVGGLLVRFVILKRRTITH